MDSHIEVKSHTPGIYSENDRILDLLSTVINLVGGMTVIINIAKSEGRISNVKEMGYRNIPVAA